MATRSSRKIGKCPRCCPDGGAVFRIEMDDALNSVWKCQNCWLTKPVRKNRPLSRPTAGMQSIIDDMAVAFGGTYAVEMIGRKAFVTFTNEKRSPFNGKMASGTVCSNGRFSIKLYRFGGDFTLTNRWHIESYFRRYNPDLREDD